METNILGGNPMWEKTTATIVFVFFSYYKEYFSYNFVLASILTSMQDPTSGGYNLHLFSNTHWKGATTPNLVYRLLLEESTYSLNKFTSYHWKDALTPSLKASTLNTFHNISY